MGQTSEKTETYPYYFIEIFERDEIYFENSEQTNYFYFKPNQEFFKDFLSACINNNFEVLNDRIFLFKLHTSLTKVL